jgi:hypothetical protein
MAQEFSPTRGAVGSPAHASQAVERQGFNALGGP